MPDKIHKNDFDGNLKYGGSHYHKSTNREHITNQVTTGDWGKDFFYIKEGQFCPHPGYFEDVQYCLCCGSENHRTIIVRKGLQITRCVECGFGFQNPRFRADMLHEIYKDSYIMDAVYSSDVARQLDEIKFLYGIQMARQFKPDLKSVLDVGCGPGYSLEAYSKASIPNIYGIDPGKYTTKGQQNFRINQSFLDVIPHEFQGLSLITLWDVLEHIHNFKRLLQSITNALRPDGLVLIMVPNFMSLATRLIREKSPTFQIDHLNYFTESSLTQVLEQTGFDVHWRETVISEIDNCRNYLEFQEPYGSTPIHEQAFAWLTPDYIHENMLGSRLFFIAKKI